MSSLLQTELRSAMEQRDAARAKLDSFATIALEAAERAKSAALDVETARSALREAAGAHAAGEGPEAAVSAARKRVRAAVETSELASAEAEGVAERLAPLESEVAKREAHISRVAARMCVGLAAEIERDALSLAGQLGRLLARRDQLAAFNYRHANGHDPLGATGAAFLRDVHRKLGFDVAGEATKPIEIDPVTLESLAGSEPEAAAAE